MSDFRNIVFDLDGTISDSSRGIVNGFRYALEKMSYTDKFPHNFREYIGAPLITTFGDCFFKNDPQKTEQAVIHYREYYGTKGKFENVLYPGIKELLDSLSSRYSLYVLTNKTHAFAQEIIDHFELRPYFKSVHGLVPGTHGTKSEIAAILNSETFNGESTLMVGDTVYDMECAHKSGWYSCFVTYGYGELSSLESLKPHYIAANTEDLRRILF